MSSELKAQAFRSNVSRIGVRIYMAAFETATRTSVALCDDRAPTWSASWIDIGAASAESGAD